MVRFKSKESLSMSEGGKHDKEITHRENIHVDFFFPYKENFMSVPGASGRHCFKRKQGEKIGIIKKMY